MMHFALPRQALVALGISVLGLAVAWASDVRQTVELHNQIYNMGTLIQSRVVGETPEEAQRYYEMVERDVDFYNKLLTVHHPSPLNNVNLYAGRAVEVPEEVALLAMRAKTAAKDSDGAFEPTIGPVVNVWKIGFGGEKRPSDEAIADAVRHVDWSKVEIWEEVGHWYIRLPEGFFMDLGGIAKGYIGTEMAKHLATAGMKSGLVDLGGNVALVGSKPDGSPWKIGLQFPGEKRGQFFGVVEARNTSVITSGAYERFLEVDGKTYGHILSPKTGLPVKTDVASVTIVSDDGTLADAWCTALFAMGWDKAEAFLRQHPDLKVVMMNADLKTVVMTKSVSPMVRITDTALHVQVLE